MSADLLRDLARAQALFQARAIAAVMGLPLPTKLPMPAEDEAGRGEAGHLGMDRRGE